MFKLIAILCSVLLCCTLSYSQTRPLSGRVTDANNRPIASASITIKGATQGVVANDDGQFTINVTDNAVLQVSSTGYQTREVAVGNQRYLTITLSEVGGELQQIVLVGTRRAGRVRTETLAPVDVISVAAPQPTSRMDLSSVLNYTAPSFNYNKQSGSDGADHVDLATLRGLGPDQTLVLINGKRRHQTSFVSVFGTRGRGNSGTDLNAIPLSAIDRVEILRDGASAQYGSDAIAGVINIILKSSTNRLTGHAGASAYYDREFNPAFKDGLGHYVYGDKLDGKTFTAGLNYGLPLGKQGGFLNLSGNFLTNGKTYRQALDTVDPVNNADGMFINPYRRANGDGSLDMVGGALNLEAPLSGQTRLYSFGTYNYRSGDAYAFTRNWSARPERFPTDAAGNLIPVPGIILTAADGEQYFNPHIQTKIHDAALAAGVRGITGSAWNWDVSNNIGYNRFHFYGDKTFNASLGASKTHFDDGGFDFLQNTTNFNLSREFSTIAAGMNLAFGAEYRYERYSIFAGEPDSYMNYNPDKASGAQGFPGYQPADEVTASRHNVGAYADMELDIIPRWVVSGAVRVENYSDFGFTDNYKFATRFKLLPTLNLRGSISTGFRAPSLQQINFSSTFTTVQGATFGEVKIAPNYSTITRAAGIEELKQERSLNASGGFSYNPLPALTITVDGYWVRIKDRVVLSGQFDATDPDIDPVLASEMARLNVSYAQFFANAVNTTNRGIDWVVDFNQRWADNRLRLLLAGNAQDMEITSVNVPAKLSGSSGLRDVFLSDRERAFILASAPRTKFTFNAEYGYKQWALGGRLNYFGKVWILGYGESGLGIRPVVPTDADPNVYTLDAYNYSGKVVTDLYASYQFAKPFTLHLGVDNLFNIHPDLAVAPGAKGWAYNNEPAGPFDAVQMGSNGRRWFARLAFGF